MVSTLVVSLPAVEAYAADGVQSTLVNVPESGFTSANTGTGTSKMVRTSGDAALKSNGIIQIVPCENMKTGGVFFTNPIKQGSGFAVSFTMYLGSKGGTKNSAADGFTFIIAKDTNQVGANGNGIGYAGIKNSIALEFDTYSNVGTANSSSTSPHISYGNNGELKNDNVGNYVLFMASTSTKGKDTTTTTTYSGKENFYVYGWVDYDAENKVLEYRVSNKNVKPANATITLKKGAETKSTLSSDKSSITYEFTDFDPDNATSPFYIGDQYYMGFTAATGQSKQEVDLISFAAYNQYIQTSGEVKDVTIDLGDGKKSTISSADSINMPPISIPIAPEGSADADFQGIFSEPNGQGEQYYDSEGKGVHIFDLDDDSTLYAYWAYTMVLNNQGVASTTASVSDGQPLPASVKVPARDGYTFAGYFTDINGGGTAYYDATGNRINDTPYDNATQSGFTLYAYWSLGKNDLTIDPNGGTWYYNNTVYTSAYTLSNLAGKTRVTIPDPTSDEGTFAGWQVSGTGGSLSKKVFTVDVGTPVILKALWTPGKNVSLVDNTDESVRSENLDTALGKAYETDNLVEDPTKGITEEDMEAGNTVKLQLRVSSLTSNTLEPTVASAMQEAVGDRTGKLYDITIKKIVTSGDDETETTNLVEIPEPVEVRIPLTGDLKGKLGYSVYRYHDGEVEHLGSSVADGEYYMLSKGTGINNSDEIVIYTRKFSPYMVVGNNAVVYTEDIEEETNNRGFDVQGKVSEGGILSRYKVDIHWGAMTFEYSTGKYWNPNTHAYDGARIYTWLPDSCFQNGNNEIIAYNHSNQDLYVTFEVTQNDLAGVDMNVNTQNQEVGTAARDVFLSKVAREGNMTAPSINAYLRLTGTPNDIDELKNLPSWKKVGVITVTLAPAGGTMTPRIGDPEEVTEEP